METEGFPTQHPPCARRSAPAQWHRELQSATVSINGKDAKVYLQLTSYSNPRAVSLHLFVVEACLRKLIEFWVLSIPRAILARRHTYEGPWRWPVLPTACHTTPQSTPGCSSLQTPHARDNQMALHKFRNLFTLRSEPVGSCVGPSVPGRVRVTMPLHVAPISIWKTTQQWALAPSLGLARP